MKSVIITGATRGIGLALARFYADKGYCLMLNGGHNEEALAAVEKELSTKTQVITCLGSVAEEKTAAAIVQKTLDTFGQIDLLINNAGIAHIGLLSDMSSEEWHTLMGINLDAVFYMSKAVIPHMVHRHDENPKCLFCLGRSRCFLRSCLFCLKRCRQFSYKGSG